MRLSYDELEKVKQKYGVDILWSFSRFNCYRTSKYEYMLKYVAKVKENNDKISAYAPLGTVCHNNIESYYEGKLSANDLPNEFDPSQLEISYEGIEEADYQTKKEDKAGTITYTYEGTVLGSVPVYFLQDISFDLGLFFQMNWYWFVLVFLFFLFVIKIVRTKQRKRKKRRKKK